MEKIKFSIDEKSLFYGLNNDMLKGHTATVATNLKQQKQSKPELDQFLSMESICNIDTNKDLIDVCLKKSKSVCKLLKVFAFKNILVNNTKLNVDFQYGMFVKEEINKDAIQYGRIKLHYPLKFSYSDGNNININNSKVMDSIQKHIGNYSFLVNGFDIDESANSINFDISIIGEKDIPYSKVFRIQKGGKNNFNKIFTEQADAYDFEISTLKNYYNRDLSPDEYNDLMNKYEEKGIKIVYEYLKDKGIIDINNIIDKYPYSPVDIEYYEQGKKKFIILKTTCTSLETFFLSKHEYMLLNDYPEDAKVFLVNHIHDKKYKVRIYSGEDIGNMYRDIMSLRIYKND